MLSEYGNPRGQFRCVSLTLSLILFRMVKPRVAIVIWVHSIFGVDAQFIRRVTDIPLCIYLFYLFSGGNIFAEYLVREEVWGVDGEANSERWVSHWHLLEPVPDW